MGAAAMNDKANGENMETRQERREKKLQKKKERMQQHGKGIIKTYADAVMKRVRGKKG
jgi:hypothetical protein